MKLFNQNYRDSNEQACDAYEPLLAEYHESALSARQVWDVEKHLTSCPSCAEKSRQMAATIDLLRSAPRHDTADDFMAKFHARLDTVEQEARRSKPVWNSLGEFASNFKLSLIRFRVPALSMGLAASLLALAIVTTHRNEVQKAPTPGITVASVQKSSISDNPFVDPVAESLEVSGDSKD